MISLTSLLVCAGLGYIVYYFFSQNINGKKQIPGPLRLPILGNLISMGRLPHIKIAEWIEKYGKIFAIGFGPYKCVILSDVKLIREAFNDPNLSGRADIDMLNAFAGGKYGIISSDGPEWVEQRRFSLRSLRDQGFGRNSMEMLIVEEVNEYLDYLKANEGKSLPVAQRFSLAVLNSLWMILASKRYPQDDPRLMEIFERNKKMGEGNSNSLALLAFPKLSKMFPSLSGWNEMMALLKDIMDVTKGHIVEHKKTFSNDDIPRDFIDAYLKEIKQTTDPTSSFYGEAGDVNLLAVVQDMFFAGSDTTATTLSWSVLYLCKFPEVQKKMQAELDSVVGKNRRAILADRPNLLYTEGVILETLRMSSLTPIGFFHTATKDVTLGDYVITKGTWIAPAQHYLHYSKKIWGNPETFFPERHLTPNGKGVTRHEALIPFTIGRRQCLGQLLALDTFFLFLTSIFQRFEVSLSPQSKNVTIDPKQGFNLAPQDYSVIVKERL